MDTRIPSTPNLSATTSKPRATPTQAKVPFAEVMGQTAVQGAEAAMRALPGGPLMAAAVRGGVAPMARQSAPIMPAQTMSQPMVEGTRIGANASHVAGAELTRPTQTNAINHSAEGPAATAPSGNGGMMNYDGALAQSQEMNLYYLQLQEQVNAQNRSFTTMSNVMKAEHETVKTAIGNIR